MTRKATTTTPDPELSTPLGNEPNPTPKSVPGKRSNPKEKPGEDRDKAPHEELEVERLEGRQESGRED